MKHYSWKGRNPWHIQIGRFQLWQLTIAAYTLAFSMIIGIVIGA